MSDFIPDTEYGECRSAISNFDKILTDLRLKGISLILALNGVSALTSKVELSWTIGRLELTLPVFLQVVVLALIYSIYRLDKLYTNLLRSAVDRAKAIEQEYSKDLIFEKSKQEGVKTKALTLGMSEKYLTTFNSIASGHHAVYWILAGISAGLIVFYLIADRIVSGS